jgi:hypothetical protein
MIVLFILITAYLLAFMFVFFHSFIIRYFPVKKPPPIFILVRILSLLILMGLGGLIWVPLIPGILSIKVTGTTACVLLLVLSIKDIIQKKVSLIEKWVIFLPYYASIFWGKFIIGLKYRSLYPYAYKLICPVCYRLNKPKDSKEYEKQNYEQSFAVESDKQLLRFNRDDPFYKNGNGKLCFGSKQRFCKYCGNNLFKKRLYFKLVCVFGQNVKKKFDKHTFVLKNPDVKHRQMPIDMTGLYIDTAGTDARQLERFIIFIMNYPAKGKPENLPVYYYGKLNTLKKHMSNLLKNSFKKLKRKE